MDSKAKGRDKLNTNGFKGELEQLCNTAYLTSAEPASRLTSILQCTIYNVFPRKIKDRKPNKSKREIPFSHELQLPKRIYKTANRQYLNNWSNIVCLQNYLIEKWNYKTAIYKAKNIAQEYKLNRLADLEKSYPKKFWADLKGLFCPCVSSCSYIDLGKWLKHLALSWDIQW